MIRNRILAITFAICLSLLVTVPAAASGATGASGDGSSGAG